MGAGIDAETVASLNEIEVYVKALKRWGPEEQAIVWLEELAELQKEICKLMRLGIIKDPSRYNLAAVAEEIADVEVVLAEMKLALGIPAVVIEDQKHRKLERLKKRLEDE